MRRRRRHAWRPWAHAGRRRAWDRTSRSSGQCRSGSSAPGCADREPRRVRGRRLWTGRCTMRLRSGRPRRRPARSGRRHGPPRPESSASRPCGFAISTCGANVSAISTVTPPRAGRQRVQHRVGRGWFPGRGPQPRPKRQAAAAASRNPGLHGTRSAVCVMAAPITCTGAETDGTRPDEVFWLTNSM